MYNACVVVMLPGSLFVDFSFIGTLMPNQHVSKNRLQRRLIHGICISISFVAEISQFVASASFRKLVMSTVYTDCDYGFSLPVDGQYEFSTSSSYRSVNLIIVFFCSLVDWSVLRTQMSPTPHDMCSDYLQTICLYT